MNNVLFKGIKLLEGELPRDVLVKDGVIAQIAPQIPIDNATAQVDGSGKVMLPRFVDAHAHLDKTLWGMEWYHNDVPSDLPSIIENERQYRAENGFDSYRQSSQMIEQYLLNGTGAVRSHVDVDTEIGLAHIEGVMEAARTYKDMINIETVCFPQSGLLQRAGTFELMDRAMQLGCDYVGGIDPSSFDRDPVRHLDQVFGLAEKHGRGVDLHLHEPGTLGAFSVELVIERTRALSMQGKVTISHGFCLGEVEAAYQHQLAKQLGEQQIHIATTAPANRSVPPFELLRSHGVHVAAGNDGIRDTWSPYGSGDMLQRAMFLGLKYRWRKDKQLEHALYAITQAGSVLLGLEDYGLEQGKSADFVIVDAHNFVEAIVAQPKQREVYRKGERIVTGGRLEVAQ
ncbi:amidohydrolase family protein [Aliagarivorans taiwanensis]|uniref:amidohydrolase family protein n=1 Tax=Aliagarivorans taiwanensis TaxID=561966 RepID=UPI000402A0A6|nr:amidohydrolase family protein [Aliagarivorans taiwanensis]